MANEFLIARGDCIIINPSWFIDDRNTRITLKRNENVLRKVAGIIGKGVDVEIIHHVNGFTIIVVFPAK